MLSDWTFNVYADGTPAVGKPFPAHRVPTKDLVGLLETKPPATRRIPFNPSAGEVRSRSGMNTPVDTPSHL